MMKFEGKWKYQSYRPDPGSLAADPNPPTFVPWSPPGVVTIDECGTTGKLEFTGTPITLDLKFQVTDGSPRGLSISAAMSCPGANNSRTSCKGGLSLPSSESQWTKEQPACRARLHRSDE